eukprot:PhM_4_TR14672/c6_g1_i1/m.87660
MELTVSHAQTPEDVPSHDDLVSNCTSHLGVHTYCLPLFVMVAPVVVVGISMHMTSPRHATALVWTLHAFSHLPDNVFHWHFWSALAALQVLSVVYCSPHVWLHVVPTGWHVDDAAHRLLGNVLQGVPHVARFASHAHSPDDCDVHSVFDRRPRWWHCVLHRSPDHMHMDSRPHMADDVKWLHDGLHTTERASHMHVASASHGALAPYLYPHCFSHDVPFFMWHTGSAAHAVASLPCSLHFFRHTLSLRFHSHVASALHSGPVTLLLQPCTHTPIVLSNLHWEDLAHVIALSEPADALHLSSHLPVASFTWHRPDCWRHSDVDVMRSHFFEHRVTLASHAQRVSALQPAAS